MGFLDFLKKKPGDFPSAALGPMPPLPPPPAELAATISPKPVMQPPAQPREPSIPAPTPAKKLELYPDPFDSGWKPSSQPGIPAPLALQSIELPDFTDEDIASAERRMNPFLQKPEVKIEPKLEPKIDSLRVEPKPELRVEPKPEIKIEPKHEIRVEYAPKIEPKPEMRIDPIKYEPRVEPKFEPKLEPVPPIIEKIEPKVEVMVMPKIEPVIEIAPRVIEPQVMMQTITEPKVERKPESAPPVRTRGPPLVWSEDATALRPDNLRAIQKPAEPEAVTKFISSDTYLDVIAELRDIRKTLRQGDDVVKDAVLRHEQLDAQYKRAATEINAVQEQLIVIDTALFEEA